MIAQVNTYTDFIENLPSDSFVVLRNKTWEDYEELLEEVGEASHLRISFDEGEIQIMTLSIGHERFERTLEKLIGSLALQKLIEIASFGSATAK